MKTYSTPVGISIFLIFIYSVAFSQYSSPLGTWDTNGKPNYLTTDDTLPSDYYSNLVGSGGVIQEYQNNSAYVDENQYANLNLVDTTQVWVTFLGEGAGWYNSLGFYTYSTGSPPSVVGDITNKAIIFANASGIGANNSSTNYAGGGDLQYNARVYLGQFPSNTTIGWYLVANGWNGTSDYVTGGNHIVYSNHNLNPESSAALKPHNIFMWDANVGKYLLSFEDQRRDGSTDNDFNDCVFMVTTIKKETGEPLTPPEGIPELDEDGGALPVELGSFDAEFSGDAVRLSWLTITETNNNYFRVFKSSDGENFIEIATVGGSGNSNVQKRYDYIDNSENQGVAYYTLEQVDFDGKVSKLKTISISKKNMDATLKAISPNPNSDDFMYLVFDGMAPGGLLEVVNSNGLTVLNNKVGENDSNSHQVDISKLKPGFYTVIFSSDNQSQRLKLVRY